MVCGGTVGPRRSDTDTVGPTSVSPTGQLDSDNCRWSILVGRILHPNFQVGRILHPNFSVGRIGSLEKQRKKERQEEPTKPKQSTTDEEKCQGKPADSKGLPSSAAAPTARSPGHSTSSRIPQPVGDLSNSV